MIRALGNATRIPGDNTSPADWTRAEIQGRRDAWRMFELWQAELPETWLAHGNPWEFDRRESAYRIGFGGEVIEKGESVVWKPAEEVESLRSRTHVARILGITQSRVSKLERAEDLNVSTLERYVAALGGELRVDARIGNDVIELTAQEPALRA